MADDQTVRLGAILHQLANRQMTTQQAASRVRTLHFPAPPPRPTAAERFAQHVRGDIPVSKPGCFAEISAAFAAGKIDRAQYDALCEAAHQAMADELKFSQDGNYTGIGDKVSHEAVGYKDGTPDRDCGNCYMYDAGHCTLVEDPIREDGVCERWVPANGPA